MNNDLFNMKKELVFYENKWIYAALASYPVTKGHVVVVWKKKITDLHLMNHKDYTCLMNVVDMVRDSMLKTLKVKKVYLLYMDEAKHVHWHLIPRYNRIGLNVLRENPKPIKMKNKTYSLVKALKKNFKLK